jgi:hypothetical protein
MKERVLNAPQNWFVVGGPPCTQLQKQYPRHDFALYVPTRARLGVRPPSLNPPNEAPSVPIADSCIKRESFPTIGCAHSNR